MLWLYQQPQPYSERPVTNIAHTDTLPGSSTLTQGANTPDLFGVTSTVTIGRVLYSAINGNIQNTAIDNVRTGTGTSTGTAVPEHGTLPLLDMGLTMSTEMIGMVKRRKQNKAKQVA